jgi:hypothetical protein
MEKFIFSRKTQSSPKQSHAKSGKIPGYEWGPSLKSVLCVVLTSPDNTLCPSGKTNNIALSKTRIISLVCRNTSYKAKYGFQFKSAWYEVKKECDFPKGNHAAKRSFELESV